MSIRIESAETGEVRSLRRENSIDYLKYEIGLHFSVPIQDQILLYGPPYRTLDGQYRPDVNLEGKRVFLYDRKMLAAGSGPRASVRLQPADLSEDDSVDEKEWGEVAYDQLPQSFLPYLDFYRRLFSRVRNWESYLKDSVDSCKKCVGQHQIQLDAIAAAIDNLKDNFNNVIKDYDVYEAKLEEQQETNQNLLDNFEVNLEKLKEHNLHPAVAIAVEQAASVLADVVNAPAYLSSMSGCEKRTLYDCIPVERERLYYKQCLESHNKATENFKNVKLLKGELCEVVRRLVQPVVDNTTLEAAVARVVAEETTARTVVEEIRQSYRSFYDLIHADPVDNNHGDVSSVVNVLEEHKSSLLDRLNLTDKIDRSVRAVSDEKKKLEESQDALSRAVYSTMQNIAALQTRIQHRLKGDVDWMKKWSTGRNQYISHLQQIMDFPFTYRAFLQEIVRRKGFNESWQAELADMTRRVGEMRQEEIRKREEFMKQHGIRLPPLLLEAVRSLKEKPPYFNHSSSPMEDLPDLCENDLYNNERSMEGEERKEEEKNETTEKGLNGPEESEKEAGGTTATGPFPLEQLETENREMRKKIVELEAQLASLKDRVAETLDVAVEARIITATISTETKEQEEDVNKIEETTMKEMAREDHKQEKLVESNVAVVTDSNIGEETKSEAVCKEAKLENEAMNHEWLEKVFASIFMARKAVLRTYMVKYLLMNRSLLGEECKEEDWLRLCRLGGLIGKKRAEQQQPEQDLAVRACSSPSSSPPGGVQSTQSPHHIAADLEEMAGDMEFICQAISPRLQRPMIAFMTFKVGDVALFMPALGENSSIWMAFNSECPHHFLSG
eukprot:scaffold289_cov169-Ochromonas_danica.AAC.23